MLIIIILCLPVLMVQNLELIWRYYLQEVMKTTVNSLHQYCLCLIIKTIGPQSKLFGPPGVHSVLLGSMTARIIFCLHRWHNSFAPEPCNILHSGYITKISLFGFEAFWFKMKINGLASQHRDKNKAGKKAEYVFLYI